MKKQQIINGIVRYIKDTMIMQIPDTFTRRIMAGFADLMAMRPEVFDKIQEKYPVMELFENEDGTYDLDLAEEIICKNIGEYGNFEIKVMGSSFIFNASDVRELKGVIQR